MTDVQLHTEHSSRLGIGSKFEFRTFHDYFVLLLHGFFVFKSPIPPDYFLIPFPVSSRVSDPLAVPLYLVSVNSIKSLFSGGWIGLY